MAEQSSEARAQAVRSALDLMREGKLRESADELGALTAGAWDATPEAVRLRALALDGLGRARVALGDAAGGIAALREAAGSLNGAEASLLPLRCHVLQNLCFALSETGATDESAAAGEEAARLAERLYGAESPELAGALFRLSAAPYRARDFARAEALILRAKAIWEAQAGPVPQQVGTCLNNLGRIHEELGDMAGGIGFHREAVAFRRTLPDREDLAFSLGNLGVALAQDGQWREARTALEEALEIYGAIGKGESREARGYAANLDICRRALAEERNL
ncbi:MAG: tetratricopeptide repeat protein [Desulfovibrio sp.]|uniref:tetratricopeptide repeat protein n=1 Tax=Desulfovibrio sp. TaxID=885 RepID=UPI001A74624F|nr:tetratricopeptide repeat protein [Desulfovibrio sp.]MBD5417308.1 tetratricopeptide repeat protein [Desulfovibrio sp.]